MNWYNKSILPKLLDWAMGSSEIESLRSDVIREAAGVVLEVGAGSGHNFPFYRNVTKLYALEPSQELTDIAKSRVNNLSFPIEFLKAGAESIPLPDKSVDTAVSTWTLCSMSDPGAALREVARVLKDGGTFVFIDHGVSPRPFTRIMQKTFTPLTKHFTGNCHMDRDIENLVRNAGFRFLKMRQFYEGNKPLMFNTQGVARVG